MVLWSAGALVNWLIIVFTGNAAIMYVDYTLFEEYEWADPGFLIPSLFKSQPEEVQ